ncbi:YraN family protein [Marinicrinis sediminis]|uniref:UPF0102 protein ACFSUC_00720 n=1 Tax=Marinicrinis sediminis TaxID=1652465 RepID=A0ABW5R4Z0_9BACL
MTIRRFDSRRQKGIQAELAARRYLQDNGYHLLHANWRCARGELDFVCLFEDRLVFVEVRSKTRSGSYGTALEAIHPVKQQQVRKVAQYYIQRYHHEERMIRFDVIAIDGRWSNGEWTQVDLQHIPNAF